MPRPSDLYATLGEPGVYQATSWTPCVLPNVFVYPPEEDNEDVLCIFHSGSASPSAFESFYRNMSYTQRDPSTFANFTVRDHALSYIQQQVSAGDGAPVFDRKLSWKNGDQVVMPVRSYSGSSTSSYSSNSSSSAWVERATAFPDTSFLVQRQGRVEGQENQKVPCRRSSIFGERPSNFEAFGNLTHGEGGGCPTPMKRSQTMMLKSRAAVVFKSFRSPRVKKPESDVLLQKSQPPDVDMVVTNRESFFLHGEGATPHGKCENRKSLAQLFHRNIDTNDFPAIGPATSVRDAPFPFLPPTPTPSPSPRDSKLSKRKSMTQLFGLVRKSGTDVSQLSKSSAGSELAAPSPCQTPPSPAGEPKLSKRKSMTQLFGIGRKASSRPMLAEVDAIGVGVDTSSMDRSEVRSATLRALEGQESDRGRPALRRSTTSPSSSAPPMGLSQDIKPVFSMRTSTPSDPTNKQSKRPKSFLGARTFPFLDFPRSHSSEASARAWAVGSPVLSTPSSVSEMPDFASATPASSYTPVSTDPETEVDDALRIVGSHTGLPLPISLHQQAGPVTTRSGAVAPLLRDQSNIEEDVDLSLRFSLYEPRDVDYDGKVDDASPLKLAARLDSLNFEQLTFDPELFAC